VRKVGKLTKPGASCSLDVWMASTFVERALGLLVKSSLPQTDALWIVPCGGIHTWFMRFSIDVLFLDKDNEVLRVVPDVGPWRFVFAPRGTYSVVELAAGNARRSGIAERDVLRID
jgi:uncharacterized membrane protein (UPF0127 family)